MTLVSVAALGDIVGQPGREAIAALLPRLKEHAQPDFLLGNGENAAGGFGLTERIYNELCTSHGFDAITMGNHWQAQQEILHFGPSAQRLVLPANMHNVRSIERGYRILPTRSGVQVAVINLLGRAFMHGKNDCPFTYADNVLAAIGDRTRIRILDIHCETSSEKQALAHHVAGRVSLVVGTHTHCPTADERIIGGKTGFITDIGMTGAYDSVVGMRKDQSIKYFITGNKQRYEPAVADLWLCAVAARIDMATGHCKEIVRYRLMQENASGGHLPVV